MVIGLVGRSLQRVAAVEDCASRLPHADPGGAAPALPLSAGAAGGGGPAGRGAYGGSSGGVSGGAGAYPCGSVAGLREVERALEVLATSPFDSGPLNAQAAACACLRLAADSLLTAWDR